MHRTEEYEKSIRDPRALASQAIQLDLQGGALQVLISKHGVEVCMGCWLQVLAINLMMPRPVEVLNIRCHGILCVLLI